MIEKYESILQKSIFFKKNGYLRVERSKAQKNNNQKWNYTRNLVLKVKKT